VLIFRAGDDPYFPKANITRLLGDLGRFEFAAGGSSGIRGTRRVAQAVIEPEHCRWVYDRLGRAFATAAAHTGTRITSVSPMALLHYREGDGYGKHFDRDPSPFGEYAKRELSATLMLRRCARGGELIVRGTVADLHPGDVVVFDARAFHEVTTVTEGERIVVIQFANDDGPRYADCYQGTPQLDTFEKVDLNPAR
jgi:predicted 2-oxoglutarate/Fe(II)-dependent dioxygenase YbiX